MQRQVTLAQAIGWTVTLAGSTAALAVAFLQFVADHEQRAALFAVGGLALAIWAALHLTDGRQHA